MKAALEALKKRYPDLALLLSGVEARPQAHEETFAFKEAPVDVLYVYGIDAQVFEKLVPWLAPHPQRMLVFLEDSLPRLLRFLSSPHAKTCVLHPQVHIVGLFSIMPLREVLEHLVLQFPTDNIAVTALHSNKRKQRFRTMCDTLYRFSTLVHVLFTELLHYPKLLANLLPNAYAWTTSFLAHELRGAFQGIPAVICGAGPSLDDAAKTLTEASQHALLIACGSAIPALGARGISPHFGIAADPNKEEFARFHASRCHEMPLLYATRLHRDVFSTMCGPTGYIRSDTGGPCERLLEEAAGIAGPPIGPELGEKALSVTTLAMALALELGCAPIYFCGVDLAYTRSKRYAHGVGAETPLDADARTFKRKDIHGRWVRTHQKWVMESECIGAFARAHPDVLFFNASMQGLGMPGIPNSPLDGVRAFPPSDLHARVHTEIRALNAPSVAKETLTRALLRLYDDLCHMHSLARLLRTESAAPLPSTGRLALLEHDFAEAKERVHLFASVDGLLARLSPQEKWRTWCSLLHESVRAFARVLREQG